MNCFRITFLCVPVCVATRASSFVSGLIILCFVHFLFLIVWMPVSLLLQSIKRIIICHKSSLGPLIDNSVSDRQTDRLTDTTDRHCIQHSSDVQRLRCSGQSGASAAEEDIATVLGPGQVGPKLNVGFSPSTSAKSSSGERNNSSIQWRIQEGGARAHAPPLAA